ncbi:hypothetical protein [Mesorhizobium sp. WSM4313]|nr:hypothetical protein [Mesorhizobium sp. WSM4313]
MLTEKHTGNQCAAAKPACEFDFPRGSSILWIDPEGVGNDEEEI